MCQKVTRRKSGEQRKESGIIIKFLEERAEPKSCVAAAMRGKEKGSTAERETRRESRDVLNGQRVEERIHAKPTRSHDTFQLRCQRAPKSLSIEGRKRFRYRFFTFPRQRRARTANWIIKRQTMLRSSTAPSSNGFSLGTRAQNFKSGPEPEPTFELRRHRRRRSEEDLINCRKSITCELSPRVL